MRLIDADEVVRIIEEKQKELCPTGLLSRNVVYGTDREAFDNWQEIIDAIDAVPTINQVNHGKWEMRGGRRYCSVCKERACVTRDMEDFWYTVGTDYCPSCGARMNA